VAFSLCMCIWVERFPFKKYIRHTDQDPHWWPHFNLNSLVHKVTRILWRAWFHP
jgi:hypothetical protein